MGNLLSLECVFYKANKLHKKGHRRIASLLALFYNTLHACDIPSGIEVGGVSLSPIGD